MKFPPVPYKPNLLQVYQKLANCTTDIFVCNRLHELHNKGHITQDQQEETFHHIQTMLGNANTLEEYAGLKFESVQKLLEHRTLWLQHIMECLA